MASVKEAFQGADSAQSAFYISQQTKYQEVEPNRFLPDSIKGNLGPSIVSSALNNLSKYDPYTGDISKPFTGEGMGLLLQGEAPTTKQEIDCRSYEGLNGLEQLIRDTSDNPNAPVRCGWRYKKSPGFLPEVSQGALGTRKGPLNNNAPEDKLGDGVQWIWDLRKAQKVFLRDIANNLGTGEGLTLLDSIAGGQYKGRMGFCTATNSMIPINADGSAAFPQDSTLNCAKDKIVTDPTKLPPRSLSSNPTQINQSANIQSIRDCATGGARSLTRDCLLQAIKTNGCSAEGTLYQALALASPSQSRWDGYLRTQPSFQTYQSTQGGNAITNSLFERNRNTWETALSEVMRLKNATRSTDPYVRVSSQDLCQNAGYFDKYDFCADLTDTTPIGSVEVKCLQSFWQEHNGKPAGTAYPTTKVIDPALGRVTTWGQYKDAVLNLKERTMDVDPIKQRQAMNQFFGVRVSTQLFSPNNLDGIEPDISPPCLGLGKPSADNQWRAYTAEECSRINGRFYSRPSQGTGYGECLKQGTGSYSWDCRYLNARQVSQLQFWVDATDGGSLMIDGKNGVRNWSDKSGKNNNLVQNTINTRPVYTKEGGLPGIQFNGTTNFLTIPNAFNMVRSNFTVFVVEKRKSDKSANYFIGVNPTSGKNSGLILGYRNNTTATMAFYYNDLDGKVDGFDNSLEMPTVWSFTKSSTGRTIHYNGDRIAIDGNRENLVSWNNATIGVYNNNFYNGIVYEILIYSEALPTAQRQKVEGYLAHKWGVASNLVGGHPFQLRAP